MFQWIGHTRVYVVEFEAMPELPITGRNQTESLYARALTIAIRDGVITEPGKYGIEVRKYTDRYNVYKIVE